MFFLVVIVEAVIDQPTLKSMNSFLFYNERESRNVILQKIFAKRFYLDWNREPYPATVNLSIPFVKTIIIMVYAHAAS